MSRYSSTNDVLFDVTVAGRPPELPGVETMVGLCINTLPLRIRINAYMPLWDWLLAVQSCNLDLRQPEVALNLEGITVTPVAVEQNVARFDLAFFMWETSEGLVGTINYSTHHFEEPTITAMTIHFKKLLQNICAQPDAHLDALKIYSEEIEMTKREVRLNKLKKVKKSLRQNE